MGGLYLNLSVVLLLLIMGVPARLMGMSTNDVLLVVILKLVFFTRMRYRVLQQ